MYLMSALSRHILEGAHYVWLAALPVSELRVAIPLAIHQGVHPAEAFALGVVGNMLPIVPLLWAFEPVTSWLRARPLFRKAVEAFRAQNLRKSRTIRRYGLTGLAIFVAIPLPGTGAWTGAMIASLLRMPFWPSVMALSIGVLAAGVIVTVLSTVAL
ncbi:MAG: COG2426 family protein [Ignavibacteriales bacterium]